MSLEVIRVRMSARCFPRVSGDEPEAQQAATLALMFSPRERG